MVRVTPAIADASFVATYQLRATLLTVLVVLLLTAFAALALWGPVEEPSCVNAIDYCDSFGSEAT